MPSEGVVKYSLDFTFSDEIQYTDIKEIEEVRKNLFAKKLIGAYADGLGFGNISLKKDNEFYITSTQTGHLKDLSEKEYSFVKSVDFNTFKTVACGVSKPSSEALTHACIYNFAENIKVIIHVHDEQLWRYMLENSFVSTSDVEYGSREMVKDLENIYANIDALSNNAFVMKGHFEGVFVFDVNFQKAQEKLYSIINKMKHD